MTDIAKGMLTILHERGVYIPMVLLRSYRELGLTDSDAMLLLQLMAFREAESNDFPTPDEIAARMGTSSKAVEQLLSRLMKEGLLEIDETLDSVSGVLYERYNWSGWLLRAAEWSAAEQTLKSSDQPVSGYADAQGRQERAAASKSFSPPMQRQTSDLFSLFEQEFGRPLSPMEFETINGWLDQDKYADELIRFALKEAVFAGKLHFRYIDRILLEWSRNRVTNADEARAHAAKFRGRS